jgi:predicted MPP superfamily phosphohydrolase
MVFLGDYAGDEAPEAARSPADRAAILQGVDALASARPPLGTFAVLGNHDWWYGAAAIEARARAAGLPVLANTAVRVERPGGAFWVAGVEDVLSARAPPSVPDALRGIPAGEPVVLLSHWPDVFFEVPGRVALTLAAHNHCGQVNLPIVGRLIAASPGSRRWPCGLYDEGGRKIYTTGGLGVSLLPVRFRTPPEIVIVTLSAAP